MNAKTNDFQNLFLDSFLFRNTVNRTPLQLAFEYSHPCSKWQRLLSNKHFAIFKHKRTNCLRSFEQWHSSQRPVALSLTFFQWEYAVLREADQETYNNLGKNLVWGRGELSVLWGSVKQRLGQCTKGLVLQLFVFLQDHLKRCSKIPLACPNSCGDFISREMVHAFYCNLIQ